ncbi:MAG: nitrate/nitrite transporter NrtS [Halioglobus sp.]
MPNSNGIGWFETAFSPEIVKRSLRVSAIVGSLLALINHGDKIIALSLDAPILLKIVLTYLVPYGVATWAAVQTARSSSGS